MTRRTFLHSSTLVAVHQVLGQDEEAGKTRNLILITTDGLRWQEVFRGADESLINKDSGVENTAGLRAKFWRDNVGERRSALMPFVWSAMAKGGQLYGNRDTGSDALVSNGRNFSYPGYNELLTGVADERIDSNDKKNNPNINILEWLNGSPEWKGKTAAFGAWDVFPYILNVERSGLMVNAGYDELKLSHGANERIAILNRLKIETGIWEGEALDAPMAHLALEYMKVAKPRVLYVAFGDTDEWAHGGRYDLYLDSAHRVDRWIKDFWDTAQAMREYRDSTTILVGVDHGRGTEGQGWRHHGEKVPESKYVWYGVLGPDTPALGERSKIQPVVQNQIASTIGAFLKQDYAAAVPQAGKPIIEMVGGR